ncbi:hypothetical protein HYX16_04590 [Candidatus Woesearchaeota archaeon]|nr:hypothetical protein [Candidatus Woesearchaeota archaeon]
MKKWINIFGVLSLIITGYGLISAVLLKSPYWYSFFVLGGTFLLGYVNYYKKNKTIFYNLLKKKKRIIKIYFIYLILAVIIDLLGRFLFNFWNYPSYDLFDYILNVLVVGYPFAFFFVYETYIFIIKEIKSEIHPIVLTIILNGLLHEIPNTFAWEWVYTFPFFALEIFKVPVIVLTLGWFILVYIPVIVERKVK